MSDRCFLTHPRLSPQGSDICFGCADILLDHTSRAVRRHNAVCPAAQAVLDADEAEMVLARAEDEAQGEELGGGGLTDDADDSLSGGYLTDSSLDQPSSSRRRYK